MQKMEDCFWDYSYPVEYRDRYGYLNGPRPVIIDDLVYAHGVTAWITCLELRTGKVVWRRNLREEFGIPQNFLEKVRILFLLGVA